MKIIEWEKLMNNINTEIINKLPVNNWTYHGIVQYIRKNHNNEYKNLIREFKLSDKISPQDFCKEALWIESEPKEQFILHYEIAFDDLTKINKNLDYIDKNITSLTKIKHKNRMLNIDQRYELNKLEYFRDKNKKARDEIINFISLEIKKYSYNKCIKSLASYRIERILFRNMPYSYSKGLLWRGIETYHPDSLTDLSNKFLDCPIDTHSKIEEIYKQPENKEIFFEIALSYLYGKNDSIYNKFGDLNKIINENHIVNRRRDILKNVFEAFDKENYLTVINILPLQIEGIFHDICQAYGIEEHQLTISSINKKLDLLKTKLGDFYLFEYYAFKFPIIRNQVAHGEILSDELKLKAIMLILDLIPVCEMCCTDSIPINKKILLIRKVKEGHLNSLLDIFRENLLDINIPEFYNLDESYLSKCDTSEFWDLIKSEIKSKKLYLLQNKEKLNKFLKILSNLENHNIAVEKCKEFRKNLSNLLGEYNTEEKNRKDEVSKLIQKIGLNNKINEATNSP